MDWIQTHASSLSNVFALMASIFLFFPLLALTRVAKQFRQFGDLIKRNGVTPDQIEQLRQGIIREQFGDGQERWLVLAGLSFALAILFILVAW